jgi:uncharacterized membrane protein YsdA (DUF1294 family)
MANLDAILLIYLALNAFALVIYGLDKGKAMRGGQRIGEGALLFSALLGPFGAYSGMRLFHHKTKKMKFKLVPVFLLLHLALIAYILIYGVTLT